MQERSIFTHVLVVSGVCGIAIGMALIVYQALLQDPLLFGGQRTIPSWVPFVFFTLIGTSLAMLFYAFVLDTLFRGWFDIVTGSALLGQWGLPVSLYLTATVTSGRTFYFLIIVFGTLNVLVALAVLGNYLRRVWPAIST